MTIVTTTTWRDETLPGFSFESTPSPAYGRARLGKLETPHGVVQTPAFIFCGTKAGIKASTAKSVLDAGAQIILSNTYHLMLQPGPKIIAEHGGLHKFSSWSGPMLTDSGGFQVFSLAHGGVAEEIKSSGKSGTTHKSVLKISEKGVKFRSYLDGSHVTLTPEKSIAIQRQLGADIILTFDECTPYHVDRDYTEKSLEMTHRWTDRSLQQYNESFDAYAPRKGSGGFQALYGISQGGVYEDLRKRSAEFLSSRDFFGYAVGGSLGNSKSQMYEVVDCTTGALKTSKPVHLLGIGGINDVFECIRYGIDTFDCVAPTRMARHASALVPSGVARAVGVERSEPRLNLRNAVFREDLTPIDASCSCEVCATVTRSYIHHLFKAREVLAQILLTTHNIATMTRLMGDIRKGLRNQTLEEVRTFWLG